MHWFGHIIRNNGNPKIISLPQNMYLCNVGDMLQLNEQVHFECIAKWDTN